MDLDFYNINFLIKENEKKYFNCDEINNIFDANLIENFVIIYIINNNN